MLKDITFSDLSDLLSKNSTKALIEYYKSSEGLSGKSTTEALSRKDLMSEIHREFNNDLHIKGDLRKWELLQIVVLSWYMEPILGYLVRLELEKIISKKKGLEDLLLSLESKDSMILFLLTSSRIRDTRMLKSIFSRKNLRLRLFQNRIFIRMKNHSKPRRKIRHKGFRDKGTLVASSKKAIREETSRELRFAIQQQQKEEYDLNIENFLQIHRNYFNSLLEGSFPKTDSYKFDYEKGVVTYGKERSSDKNIRERNSSSESSSEKDQSREEYSPPGKKDRESEARSIEFIRRFQSRREKLS